MLFTTKKPFYKKAWFLIFFTLLFILALIRTILPSVIVMTANKQLEKRSPYMVFHIDDIDFKILRGEYVLKGIIGTLKPQGETFLTIQDVVAKVPWKGIFKGSIIADVTVDKMNLIASQELFDKANAEKNRMKEEAEQESQLRVRTFTLRDSNIVIQNLMSFKGSEKRKITDLNIDVSNMSPTQNNPITNFNLSASVFGSAPFKVVGRARLLENPPQWDLNTEMKNFHLTTINPFIREKMGAFIHKGNMDFYAEAESKDGKIDGYIKPFVKKLKMDTPKGGFNFKGEAAKNVANLVKMLLTDSEAKTLATKVPFEYKEKFKIEVLPALTKAIVHKAKQNIQPGIEDNIGQKGIGLDMDEGLKQAQEENNSDFGQKKAPGARRGL